MSKRLLKNTKVYLKLLPTRYLQLFLYTREGTLSQIRHPIGVGMSCNYCNNVRSKICRIKANLYLSFMKSSTLLIFRGFTPAGDRHTLFCTRVMVTWGHLCSTVLKEHMYCKHRKLNRGGCYFYQNEAAKGVRQPGNCALNCNKWSTLWKTCDRINSWLLCSTQSNHSFKIVLVSSTVEFIMINGVKNIRK